MAHLWPETVTGHRVDQQRPAAIVELCILRTGITSHTEDLPYNYNLDPETGKFHET